MEPPPHLLLRVLGEVGVECDGQRVELSPAERAILARLAVEAPAAISVELLSDAVWPGGAPGTGRASLHNHLARLRTKLGPTALERSGERYRLGAAVVLDSAVLLAALEDGERRMSRGDAAELALVCAAAEQALRMATGPAYEGVGGAQVLAAAVRLNEVVAAVQDLRAAALVGLERYGSAVVLLQRLVVEDAGRERRWTLLVQALHGQGRRGDALAAYAGARRQLGTRTGLDPGSLLSRAVRAVLEDGPVGGPGGDVEAGLPSRLTPLVGREVELAAMQAQVGAGTTLLALLGPADAGTSRLAVALAHRLARLRPGACVVQTRCESVPDVPLQPLVDLAEALRDRLEEVAWAKAVGPDGGLLRRDGTAESLPSWTWGPADVSGRLVRALAAAAHAAGGVVAVVDDVALAGPTSASVLRRLALEPGVVVLVTATDQAALPVELQGSAHAAIGGLSGEQVQTLVALLLEREQADVVDLAAWVERESGGLPGLVRTLLAGLLATGELRAEATGPLPVPHDADVPAGLARRVRARLAELDAGAVRALETAVLLDDAAELLLGELCSPADVASAYASGMLPASGLVRRLLAADLPTGRRVEVLAAAAVAAQVLGMSPQSVARYRVAAAELDPYAAVLAAGAAGGHAQQAGAFGEAAAWYDRALGILSDRPGVDVPEPAVLDLLVRRGDAQRLAGRPEQADQLLVAAERVLTLAATDPALSTLRRRAALAVAELGGTSEAGSANDRAAAVADRALLAETDPLERAVLSAAASMVHSMGERPQRCRELFLAAEADSRGAQAARRRVLPFTYLALGHPDDLPQRRALTTELLAAGAAAADPVAECEGWHLAVSVALTSGDGPGLRTAAARLAELAGRLGDVGRRWQAGYTAAAVAHLEGRLGAAEQLSEQALETGSGITASRALAVHGAQLLDVRRAQGRLGELAPLFEQLVLDQPGVHAWHAAAGLARAADGPEHDLGAARAHLDQLLAGGPQALPRDFTWLASMAFAGRTAAAVGSAAGSDAERVELLRSALAPYGGLAVWTGSCAYGPVATICALLTRACGDVAAARSWARRGEQLAISLGAPLFAAEARALQDSLPG